MQIIRLFTVPILVLASAIADSDLAGAAPPDGGTLARRWCSACHMIAPNQPSASDGVPSFAEIAGKRPTANTLRAFLATPHPRMPDMALTRQEIDMLVGYIRRQAR